MIAAIAATGYTPNASARNLRARSTNIVLALVPGMSNTFFTPILNAIEDALSAAGYGMIIGDTRGNPQKESHYTRFIRRRAGRRRHPLHRAPAAGRRHLTPDSERVPIALVCNEIVGDDRFSVFDVDNRDAARRATAHLVAAGHRRIANIAGAPDNIEARARLKGFREALAAAGLPIDEDAIWTGGFRFENGVPMRPGSFSPCRKRPTAVFAAADDAAIGFIRTVRDAGVRTPEDVSVVGFDDIDYASVIDPPLTTMRQPREELGRLAAEDLLARMGRDTPHFPPRERASPLRTDRAGKRPADRRRRHAGAEAAGQGGAGVLIRGRCPEGSRPSLRP